MRDETDVVVIGSGAGGAPVAYRLAQAGARVTILERGPWYGLTDFTHDEVAMCRRDFFVPYPYRGHHPHTIRKNGEPHARPTQEGWISLCVGGGTVHMSGFTYRLHEQDFGLADLTGGIKDADLADWPIDLEQLQPYYEMAEVLIGVSGQSGTNPYEARRKPYPLPPLKPHPIASLVDQAAGSLGFQAFPTPRAILSQPYAGRPPCNYCGFCGEYGCENASKSSVLTSLIPMAEQTGRCRILPRCMAVRIETDDRQRARKVVYLDPQQKLRSISARVVVLAASAIESARLLLLSENNHHPHGLANGCGLVGKNLTFSTFGKATAIFDRMELISKLGQGNMDLPFVLRSVQDDYWIPQSGLLSPKGGTYNFLLHHPNAINAAVRLAMDSDWSLWGQALKDRIQSYFHNELWLEFEVFGEFLPWKGCYVDLDPKYRDAFGLPVARITIAHHPVDGEINRYMVRRGMEILSAVKPAPRKVTPWTWANTTYHLQHGTMRFGDHPDYAVLNRFCETHEVKNLYVTDGSFMPTSGGVPATPTIIANALRVADHIADRFVKKEID